MDTLQILNKLPELVLFQTHSGTLRIVLQVTYPESMFPTTHTILQWHMQYIHKWVAMTLVLGRSIVWSAA